MERERMKLNRNLEGIRDLSQLPDALFVVDPKRESIGVAEANKLGIPVIGIVDTNCDPELVDYVIPGNDDAIRTIRLFAGRICDAYLDGAGKLQEQEMIRSKDAPQTAVAPAVPAVSEAAPAAPEAAVAPAEAAADAAADEPEAPSEAAAE